MATAITFNGYSLQGAQVLSDNVDRYDMPDRDLQTYPLSYSDRQKVVTSFYRVKPIVVGGTLLAASETALQTLISTLRKNLAAEEAILAIPFNGVTLQYTATVKKFRSKRSRYNTKFIPYMVEFQVVNPPFGIDSASQNHSNDNFTGASESDTLSIGGEVAPEPVITITVNSETDLSAITFTQDDTGTSMTISPAGGFTAADVVIINTATKSVLYNGSPEDYSGRFPVFQVGTNNYTVDSVATARDLSLDIDWQDYYL